MKITFNNIEIDLAEAQSLGQFLAARGVAPKGIAVAVNNKVVRRDQWDSTILADGDKILVITAVCGG